MLPALAAAYAGWELFSAVKNAMPVLEDEAVVTVWGQPGTTKKELWKMAAATAFSMVRRWDMWKSIPPVSLIMVEYDAASNLVRFTVRYRTNLAGAEQLGDGLAGLREAPLYSGPGETVVGGPWNFRGAVPGMPIGKPKPNELAVPRLGWAGKVILTNDNQITPDGKIGEGIRVPNPRPLGDARSKSTLVNLIYAALGTPDEAEVSTQVFPSPLDSIDGIPGNAFTPDLFGGL